MRPWQTRIWQTTTSVEGNRMTESPGTRGPVIVGVFPGQPDRVVREAARLAARLGTELVCAHVDTDRYRVSERPNGSVSSLPVDPDLPDMRQEGFDAGLAGSLTEILSREGVTWSTRDLAGHPAEALGRLAETLDAELIVVGTRRHRARGSVHDFFSGSVAAQLAHRQGRPVVVVPVSPVGGDAALPWE